MKRTELADLKSLVAVVALCAAPLALAAPPPGKGKPPVETSNNLSYPTLFYGTAGQTGVIGSYTFDALFPSGMSWGCLKPEVIGTTTYPNTSCVDDEAPVVTPVSPAACVAPGGKCEGFEYINGGPDDPNIPNLEPIYWQKNPANAWQAYYLGSGALALPVDYVDWGDNLESRTWPVQVIRVETNTFSTLVTPGVRFDVWHVFGQGTNELWGAHATSGHAPYVYVAWPYAVNVAPAARLNIAKLVLGTSTCPTTYTPAPVSPTWDAATSTWANTWTLYDAPYTAELNIKGSYVYGYNWNLRADVVPPNVDKSGWWRLTFYTLDGAVDFSTWTAPTETNNPLAPPGAPLTPAPLIGPSAAEEEGDTGQLYVPVVDQVNNLTYIDLCIAATKDGGKKGGNK